MSSGVKHLSFFLLTILLSLFLVAEARPLPTALNHGDVGGSLLWLSLGAVKDGPSPGEGHKYSNGNTLGGINDSRSSPSEGHRYTDTKTLGKDSGPSPGEGNKNENAKTLGGIKDSGPSPGDGHKYTDANTLGGIKDFDQSPGDRHKHNDAKNTRMN